MFNYHKSQFLNQKQVSEVNICVKFNFLVKFITQLSLELLIIFVCSRLLKTKVNEFLILIIEHSSIGLFFD